MRGGGCGRVGRHSGVRAAYGADSGRSAVVITPKPLIDVPAYLDAFDLFTQVTVIAASISDAVSTVTEDISRLAKWSGGEKLTVCVALYCTIVALRTVCRTRHSGYDMCALRRTTKAKGALLPSYPVLDQGDAAPRRRARTRSRRACGLTAGPAAARRAG